MSTILNIRVCSFSFHRRIPADSSGNGGGHVFDCRCLPNPGLRAEYKKQTGLDTPVIAFFERHKDVAAFIEDALAVIHRSIRVYQQRNYTHLMISCGCTGGQHRSVYCAKSIAKEIQSIPNLSVIVEHRELARQP